jgi:hypothetical protein
MTLYAKCVTAIVVVTLLAILLTGNLGLLVPVLPALWISEAIRRQLKL